MKLYLITSLAILVTSAINSRFAGETDIKIMTCNETIDEVIEEKCKNEKEVKTAESIKEVFKFFSNKYFRVIFDLVVCFIPTVRWFVFGLCINNMITTFKNRRKAKSTI